jgi:FkbM family methyltransferase
MSSMRWASLLASLTRLYPFYSGCGTLANHKVMRVLSPPSAGDLVWAKTAGGEVLVSLNDYVGRAAFFFGDVDPKITWIISRLLRSGDGALDVGANLGVLTLLMAKLVGPTGTVHAFEPNPMLCQRLEQTLSRNQAKNVKLHAVALGASETRMDLRVPRGNFGAASLVRKIADPAQTHSVTVRKLDDVIFQEANSRIAFMKLDVEGFELEVLRGAQRLLERLRPAVLFETNEKGDRGQVSPVMKFLKECDYEFLTIPRRLLWMKTSALDLNDLEPNIAHDVVALPRGDRSAMMRHRLRAH